MSISDNHRGNDSLNLGKPSKPKYATEQQDESVAIIRSSFRSEMSNFSNSIKYLGKLLNFQIFPVANKKDCTTAHLFGFSQQTGLCFRPQMKLQKLTQDVLKNLGSMVVLQVHWTMYQISHQSMCVCTYLLSMVIIQLTGSKNTLLIIRTSKSERKAKLKLQLHRGASCVSGRKLYRRLVNFRWGNTSYRFEPWTGQSSLEGGGPLGRALGEILQFGQINVCQPMELWGGLTLV